MGLFSTSKRRGKSVQAQINKVAKALEKKKLKAKLAAMRKQLRGF